jgi:acetyl esterase/lipase
MRGLAALGMAAALLFGGAMTSEAPPRLMDWPDLTGRPMPPATKRIAYGDRPSQVAELWLPDGAGPHPVVLMVHGGCWQSKIATLTLMSWAAEDLRRRGIAVWNIEYRGVDEVGGGYPGTFLDAAAAADALRSVAATYGLDTTRIVAFGHSAGGHLAMWLAARRRLRTTSPLWSIDPLPIHAVVSSGGLPDLAADKAAKGEAACGPAVIDRLTGPPTLSRPDVFSDTSPAARLPIGIRQEIVNGALDRVAPPWLGRAYAEKARAAGDGATLTVIDAAGHVELISPGTNAWAREVGIIEQLLRR